MRMRFTAKYKPNPAWMRSYRKAEKEAFMQTGQDVYLDLVESQTVPYDTGFLQHVLTRQDFKKVGEGFFRLASYGPYARRLYFNPQYNFQQGKNRHAGGRWYDPYLPGHAKGRYIPSAFAKALKGRMEAL